MLDPVELYELSPQGAAAALVGARTHDRFIMVDLVRGFMDAGGAGRLAAEHLTNELPTIRVATFDVDRLLDYRSHRPAMTFDVDRWVDYSEPALVLDLIHDGQGVPFLLLHGIEPDVQWERFIKAVKLLVAQLEVNLVVSVHGVPMNVPHTRPIGTTMHGTNPDLVTNERVFFSRVSVPSSVSALLEYRLGQSGIDAGGIMVHVPHYLAGLDYPATALAGLNRLGLAMELDFKTGALELAAEASQPEVEHRISENEEIAELVSLLEREYDTRAAELRTNLLADLPTADEIAQQVEQFLATQPENDKQPENDNQHNRE